MHVRAGVSDVRFSRHIRSGSCALKVRGFRVETTRCVFGLELKSTPDATGRTEVEGTTDEEELLSYLLSCAHLGVNPGVCWALHTLLPVWQAQSSDAVIHKSVGPIRRADAL
eukprot:354620-Pyramimonas_sp.AAC.1